MTWKTKVWRATIEVGLIIVFLYSTLLMREMERTGRGRGKGLLWALGDILTLQDFMIAVIAGLIGYLLVERLRNGPDYVRRQR